MSIVSSHYGTVVVLFLGWIVIVFAGTGFPMARESVSTSSASKGKITQNLAQTEQGGIGRPLDLSRPNRNETDADADDDVSITPPNSLENSIRSYNAIPGLGAKFEGIWGLTDSACENTRKVEDISDDRTLAIIKNRIIFVDSQCLILEVKGDFTFGQTASVRCKDIDGQTVETKVKFKPIGALKLEISSVNQRARQYVYCAGLSK